jgi:hypothetical protein
VQILGWFKAEAARASRRNVPRLRVPRHIFGKEF